MIFRTGKFIKLKGVNYLISNIYNEPFYMAIAHKFKNDKIVLFDPVKQKKMILPASRLADQIVKKYVLK